jgi:hypothetical protein
MLERLGPAASPTRVRANRRSTPLALPPDSPYRRLLRGPGIYVLVVLLGVWAFMLFANRGRQAGELKNINQFESAVASGDVRSATFLEGDQKITGELSDGSTYSVAYPASNEEALT